MKTLRDEIKDITRKHLKENNSFLLSQNTSAVGWINNTVPDDVMEHIVELPTSDVMNSGIVTGIALTGKRPIYVIRFQPFSWLNASFIVNYAAKSKELWNVPCPIFIRSIARCGKIGPVASNSCSSIYKVPGMKIFSPMTVNEYRAVYNQFMKDDCPYYVSEHANSFGNSQEFSDTLLNKSDFTLIGIGISRFEIEKCKDILNKKGYNVSVIHVMQLKPFELNAEQLKCIKGSNKIVLVDDDYVDGMAKPIAYDIMVKTKKIINVVGLEDRTSGFSDESDNLPPSVDMILQECLK